MIFTHIIRKSGIQVAVTSALLCLMHGECFAQNQSKEIIELETTTIKGNTELPKYLYVVPWQDSKTSNGPEQKLVLHNLYADLFDPVMPSYQEPIKRTILHSGGTPQ